MGGKDVLYVRQEVTSDPHDPASIQKLLTETASLKFMDSANNHCVSSQDLSNIKEVPWTSLFWPCCMFCWKSKISNYKMFQAKNCFE
jgi:hypothetical protein